MRGGHTADNRGLAVCMRRGPIVLLADATQEVAVSSVRVNSVTANCASAAATSAGTSG